MVGFTHGHLEALRMYEENYVITLDMMEHSKRFNEQIYVPYLTKISTDALPAADVNSRHCLHGTVQDASKVLLSALCFL